MSVNALFRKSGKQILDLLFPPQCVCCKASKAWLCARCVDTIAFIDQPVCRRCGEPSNNNSLPCRNCRQHPLKALKGIRAAAHFESRPLRDAIHNFKYRNQRVLAAILGQMLVDTLDRFNIDFDIIIPVPLHRRRLNDRGFNQSELLATEVSRKTNRPMNTTWLQRVRNTKTQVNLTAEQRYQNVSDAFLCSGDNLRGRTVLLIDDVCTTGATLDACALALQKKEVSIVWGLTLAKAIVSSTGG
ncbi:MAG: ComF family protein [Anaerolineae bacterium]|nr:ComF family protein [Anaerolineae bacterium]